ncbi:hypothetical protein AG1IA_09788 [Rhizoctonia solani AG-1 IA]|uniref:Uncharacterized protein n=1 Tax=Thanatephorus cucumeris (strain AG1-IA) TaxID=983506 RepID=L8WDC2_THACA|nr:hypothetical protein AG1IA_09788 [Rhizoctonia solani AG-1 IA]
MSMLSKDLDAMAFIKRQHSVANSDHDQHFFGLPTLAYMHQLNQIITWSTNKPATSMIPSTSTAISSCLAPALGAPSLRFAE